MPILSCLQKAHQSTQSETRALTTAQSQSVDIQTHESDTVGQAVSYNHHQLLNNGLPNGPAIKQMQVGHASGQEMVNYIAQKESWYSVVDSTRTTQYWIPTNKTALPINQ